MKGYPMARCGILVRRRLLAIAALAVFGINNSFALDYPTRPVHWIVGFSAGGPNDTVARIIGHYLSDRLGQQFIIENKTGAGGS
ncbi:MAG: tripartite tricarboxylate transporter substrate binding protein, partial [Pseudolabrys sp.]